MPWTVADVDRHKKGLSKKQKEQWVNVANSALAKCRKDGGSNCDASAIRQANSVVGGSSNQCLVNIGANDYEIRRENYDNKQHIVVPVIMMTEGVHCGSHGPLLHLADEYGRYVDSWNGTPVVVQHPQDDAGQLVSANSPEVLDREVVGRVFNSHIGDQGQLRGEVWLDENRLEQISPLALQYILQKKPLDVSTGVFNDEEVDPGTYSPTGEEYDAIARNHRPDHLALLPGVQGACSWSDGCGIRANKKGGDDLDSKDDLSDNKMIRTKGGSNTMGDPKDIDKKPCPECIEKAKLLVQSEHSTLTEADMEWLQHLPLKALDQLVGMQKKESGVKEDPPQINEEQISNAIRDQFKTPEQVLNLLPEEMRDQLKSGLVLHKAEKEGLVKRILAHSKAFTEDELNAKGMDELNKLSSFIPVDANYGPNGSVVDNASSHEEEVLFPTGINPEEEK